jgi:hypothetical protein
MRRLAPYAVVMAAAVMLSALLPTPERGPELDAAGVARATGMRVLGATRGYATTALWLRAGDAYRRGDHYEVLAAYQLIAELQPRNPAVYSYLAWNQAYNISAEFPERERREEWVARGFDTLHRAQDRLPREPSLRQDEWNFVLNRSDSYPGAVLRVERARHGAHNPIWAAAVDAAMEIRAGLAPAEAAALDAFLDNVGLVIGLFDLGDAVYELPEDDFRRLMDPRFDDLPDDEQGELGEAFHPIERFQVRALMALGGEVRGYLALCHWCRLHAMVLAITPALDMHPHGLDVELSTLNACRLAFARIPPLLRGGARQEIEAQYKEAVAQAFVAGIENALRIGGRERAEEFIDAVEYNFRGMPELLPEDVIHRALQEITG